MYNCNIHGIAYDNYCMSCVLSDSAGVVSPKSPVEVGLKYDSEKPRMDLLDPDFLEGVSRVLGFGAKKYAAHNWRNGIEFSRLIGAAYRHLGAINRGEDIDSESGLRHVEHLGCCVMFLSWMMQNRTDLDDRYKGKVDNVQFRAKVVY